MMDDLSAILFLGCGLCLFTVALYGAVYYVTVRQKYNAFIEQYRSKNFREPMSTSWFKQFGLLGVYGACGYFRKLLKGKRILVARGEYLDEAPYLFVNSLDRHEYAWFYRLLLISRLLDIFTVLWIASFVLVELIDRA
ncbi:hypothetical protein V2T44_08445 [Serratia ficaria]|uniref:hypothetical protein n=1 Tax=Serratia ficaria TaxID=61651 RepID=UPI0021BDD33D|nr:hypothetical protein [Serratia ficaria]MEE4482977.1 hypothetical protein [Serratia ficaria]